MNIAFLLLVLNPFLGGLKNPGHRCQVSAGVLINRIVFHAQKHKPQLFEPDGSCGTRATVRQGLERLLIHGKWIEPRDRPDFTGFFKKLLGKFLKHLKTQFAFQATPLIVINQGLLFKFLFGIHGEYSSIVVFF
ncbi:hypothetical protein [Limnobacter sp.]|uniref:hypothetical protein n=1 Tax=Limnobacter sp. TaxID=2003368 RepID=UPI002FDFAF89